MPEKDHRGLELRSKAAISAGCAFAYGRFYLAVSYPGAAKLAKPLTETHRLLGPDTSHLFIDGAQPVLPRRTPPRRADFESYSRTPFRAPLSRTALKSLSLRKYCLEAVELASAHCRHAGQEIGQEKLRCTLSPWPSGEGGTSQLRPDQKARSHDVETKIKRTRK